MYTDADFRRVEIGFADKTALHIMTPASITAYSRRELNNLIGQRYHLWACEKQIDRSELRHGTEIFQKQT